MGRNADWDCPACNGQEDARSKTMYRFEATPKTPPGWFVVANPEGDTIAFCGPPKAPNEPGQGYVILSGDLPAMHLELLATLDAKIEATALDQQNIGATTCAQKLLEIARTGEHRGTFGGPEIEECAQAILDLYNGSVRQEVVYQARRRLGCEEGRNNADLEELVMYLTKKLDAAEAEVRELRRGMEVVKMEDIPL